MPAPFASARAVISKGLEARAYPAAAVEVGRARGPIWAESVGRLSYDDGAPVCDPNTIFDLASLTKVIATTSIAMRQVESGRLALDERVADRRPDWRSVDRRDVTVRHLLEHASGLPAHVRLWESCSGREEYERAIAAIPLAGRPGAAAVYSDVAFIELGFLLEDAGGASLAAQFAPIADAIGGGIGFLPAEHLRSGIAPTEYDPWRGRLLQGEVHDENAAALGGVAAHAGLFGTAAAVGAFARLVLETFTRDSALAQLATIRTFATRSAVPESSRALGWDTMRPTSSCGTRMSPTAIGHTGFTGTSLWIDWERDLYVVWLTNRVHPTRTNEALVKLRPQLHDAVMDDVAVQA